MEPTSSTPREWRRGPFTVSTDPARLQLHVIHGYLTRSYWSAGIPIEIVSRALAGSLDFGLYDSDVQIGFARVVSDRATFAWVCDVFVLEEWRRRGLARWLIECVRAAPELQGLRRWILATRDAHRLYAKTGYTSLAHPETFMERWDCSIYSRSAPQASSE